MRKTIDQLRHRQVCNIPAPPEIQAARSGTPEDGLTLSGQDNDNALDRAFDDSPTVLAMHPTDEDPSSASENALAAEPNTAHEPLEQAPVQNLDDIPIYVGPYEIVGLLGEGGQGVVYEALQQTPARTVALKVIRRSPRQRDVMMFEREANTLARLRHGGIAALYEVGHTEEGQHYFAMELVEGTTLREHFEKQNPSLAQRLELFLGICDAVNYAHQKGVIHRDIKPSNILIDGCMQPKMLDFGLARITDNDAEHCDETEVGHVRGTPKYMSPEQVRGSSREIDVRSDIYTLGVLLYEMLTGRLPYTFEGTGLYHAAQVICQQEPIRPGTLNPQTRGDLEAILLKALEKDAPRRYQSVSELANDIRRHLNEQPVRARRAGAWYHGRKFLRRHKLLTMSLAVAALMSAGFLGYTRKQEARVQRAVHVEAQAMAVKSRARQLSQDVNGLLKRFISSANPLQAPQAVDNEGLLDEAAARIDELADSAETAIALHGAVGLSYRGLGRFEQAEHHLSQALHAAERTLAEDPLTWAACAQQLARVKLEQGQFDAADKLLSQSFSIRNDILNADHPDVASTLYDLAQTRAALGHDAQARDMLQGALAAFEAHEDRQSAARTQRQLSIIEGQPSSSVKRHVAAAQATLGETHPDSAAGLMDLAEVTRGEGDLTQARELYLEAVKRYEATLPEDHPRAMAAREKLVELLCLINDLDQAETQVQRMLELKQAKWGSRHPEVARATALAAQVRQLQGDAVGAEPLYRKALAMYRTTTPANDPGERDYLVGLCRCLLAQNRYIDAVAIIDQIEALR